MNKNTKPFLTEGLNVYPEAMATVKFFEDEISRQLLNAAGKREKWLPLKNHRVKAEPTHGDGTVGYYVAIVINGTSPHEESLKIDCGIWWDTFKGIEQPVVYASFMDGPKQLQKFQSAQKNQDILRFERWNRTFLYLPLADPADIETSLNTLMDELLIQLA